jgi:hypothetical protein
MFFKRPYVIDLESAVGKITLKQPTIGDIINIGEARFYGTLSIFVTNTTSHRLMLWGDGNEPVIDWNIMSDFELFMGLILGADKEVYSLFLQDLDLSKFERVGKNVGDKKISVLYDVDDGIEINEEVYWHISQYLREMFSIFPEEKLTDSPILKSWYIESDRKKKEIEKEKAEKGESEQSSLLPIISSYLNHPGTKYKSSELESLGVYEFWDGVQRLQIYEQSTACLKGLYSGMVDGSKVSADSYNFMKEIKHESTIKDTKKVTSTKTIGKKKKK